MQLANEVDLNPDSLMNTLRVSALQGELTAHSLAPVAVHGTFNAVVEEILEELACEEDVPLDKLRGWLLRQTTLSAASSAPRAGTPSHYMTPSPTCGAAFSPCANSDSPDAGQRVGFASFRRGSSSISRATPSPTAAAGIVHKAPAPPGGNEEPIRVFGRQESGNTMRKSGSVTWRSSKRNSLTQRKSGDVKWRGGATEKGCADDARW